jgi:hypothetical protein
MASFTHIPTLVYTAVLGLDLASAADLARIAFGVLLWIVLVVLNGAAAGASPRPSAFDVRVVPSPHRPQPIRDRFDPPEAA